MLTRSTILPCPGRYKELLEDELKYTEQELVVRNVGKVRSLPRHLLANADTRLLLFFMLKRTASWQSAYPCLIFQALLLELGTKCDEQSEHAV